MLLRNKRQHKTYLYLGKPAPLRCCCVSKTLSLQPYHRPLISHFFSDYFYPSSTQLRILPVQYFYCLAGSHDLLNLPSAPPISFIPHVRLVQGNPRRICCASLSTHQCKRRLHTTSSLRYSSSRPILPTPCVRTTPSAPFALFVVSVARHAHVSLPHPLSTLHLYLLAFTGRCSRINRPLLHLSLPTAEHFLTSLSASHLSVDCLLSVCHRQLLRTLVCKVYRLKTSSTHRLRIHQAHGWDHPHVSFPRQLPQPRLSPKKSCTESSLVRLPHRLRRYPTPMSCSAFLSRCP